MKRQKKDKSNPATSKEKSIKGGRREFLERTGLTAGGVLMTTLAAGGISKGQTDAIAQERQLSPDEFKALFDAALTDRGFQNDILAQGFKALDARGYNFAVPPEERIMLEKALIVDAVTAKPRCGVCGVCGACGLCAEVNLGSASAALWALFALA
jgi:hypothetical protein